MTKQLICFLVVAAFTLIEVSFAENNTTPPPTTAPFNLSCVLNVTSDNVTKWVCPTDPSRTCINVTGSDNGTKLVCNITTAPPTTTKPGNGATTTQGPTGTGATATQGPTVTGATATQGSTVTGATATQGPTGTGATATQGSTGTGATATQGHTGTGATTAQGPTGTGATTTHGPTGTGTTATQGPEVTGASTTKSSSGPGSEGSDWTTTKSTSGGSEVTTTVATPAPGETPVNGMWTEWSNWACEQCGAGRKTRTRSCTNPEPSGGGQTCSGDDEEKGENCNPCSEVEVSGNLTFNEEFQPGMEKPDSPEAKAFCGSFQELVMQQIPETERVDNCTLTEGSIIVTFKIVFVVKSNASSAPVNFTKVIEEQIIKTGKLGNFTFDPNSFVVTKVSVDGVTFGEWKADTNLCTSMCCGAGNVNVYENRTCTEVATSCTGLIVNRVIGCSPACDGHKKCPSSSSGVNVQISALTLILAALFSLRMLH